MPDYCLYSYDGPVLSFGRCIANNWYGETYAVTAEKAKSNLIYQYKKQNKLLPGTRIELPGKVMTVETA